MKKYTFKEVRNGVPMFVDENGYEYGVILNAIGACSDEAQIFRIAKTPNYLFIGDTVAADIHEGKLINLKLVDQPEKFPMEPNNTPRANHSVRHLNDPQ